MYLTGICSKGKLLANIRLGWKFKVGNVKAKGREPESCSGWVFHFKFGCFAAMKEVHGANTCPCLKLKSVLEVTESDKHSSLLRYGINFGYKKVSPCSSAKTCHSPLKYIEFGDISPKNSLVVNIGHWLNWLSQIWFF